MAIIERTVSFHNKDTSGNIITYCPITKVENVEGAASEDYVNDVASDIQTQLDSKSASGHTHSYAGSSSAGGSANSADKINTDAGSTTQPVYFKDGVPVATTYTLGKSVPSNAVFTDTNTKVTNTLATTTKAYLTGTTSASTNTGTQVFDTGVYLSNTAGELVATKFTGALSGNATSATKATQDASGNIITDTYATKSEVESATSTAKSYTDTAVANLIGSADSTMDTLGEIQTAMEENADVVEALHEAIGSKASADHTHNYAGSSSVGGAATSANKLNTNAGNASTPVYFSNGVPVACTSLALEVTGVSESATKDSAGNVIVDTYETKANAITGLSASGKTVTYTKGDGTTGTITTQDTTYTAMTSSEATTGTATTARSITAKVLHDKINEVVEANAYSLPTSTSSVLGGVKTGSNITNTSGTISITKDNVTSALGYTPPTTNTTYSAATTSAAGLMSAADKTKLDGIATGANNYTYTLPTASSSTLGGVKTTSTVTSTSGLTACPIISGVPYYKDTNTTYSLSSFGITATADELNILDGVTTTATELNYVDGVTSNIQTQLDSKSASGHTHSYAGSSSAGGAATSANKINTDAGSATQPVYFANGIPVKTTYTLGASVPSGAKFTDTVYTHPSYTAASSGLYKLTVDSTGHVSATSAVAKSDITALGIPEQDTVYTLPNATSSVLGGVKVGSNISVSSGTISLTKANVTSALGYTPPTTNTTYSNATTSTAGLMSASDKSKLDSLDADLYTIYGDTVDRGSSSPTYGLS